MSELCIHDGGPACPRCGQTWPENLVLPVWRTCLPPCPHQGEKMGAFLIPCCGGQGRKRVAIFACSLMGTCTERPTPVTAETHVELAATHRACLGCPRTMAGDR